MPRNIPPGIAAHLQSEQLTIAVLVRVERQDGVVFGFGDIDKDLVFDGITYESSSAQDASAISARLGVEGSNLDVVGLLTSDRITDTDLLAGRYEGADVQVFIVNYMEGPPITERVILLSGAIGDLQFGPGHYTAEVRSLMQRLSQNIGELTSQTCLVKRLGDERCKVNLAGFQFNRTVAQAPPATPLILYFAAEPAAGDYTGTYYAYGTVQFTTGLNAGIEKEVKIHTLDTGNVRHILTLQEAFPFAVAVGDIALLSAGCNRTFEQCKARFGNAINYRGMPFLPGSDKILQIARH